MKKLLIAFLVAGSLPFALTAQSATDQLKPFTKVMNVEGLQLALIVVTDKTAPVLFQPPTLYAIRARANEMTTLYVQGTAVKDVEIDTTKFTIEQAGSSSPAQPSNIKNFEKGKAKVKKGDRVDGLLTFAKKFDLKQPFTVKYGKEIVDFRLDPDLLDAK